MTTYTWIGATGNWGAAGNWSLGELPDASDASVVFNQSATAFVSTVEVGQTYLLNTLVLNVAGAVLDVGGTLDFSGTAPAITIDAGTLQLGTTGTLAGTLDVTIAATGTLDLNNTTQTIGGLSGSGSILLEQGDLRLGAGDASGDFSGTIQAGANGEIEKIGIGGLTLAGVGMAGGAIYVEAGSLVADSGANDIAYLAVGEGTGNTGSFDLSGGTLTIGMDLQVGDYGGVGTFNQTGGVAAVNGSLNIGNQGGTGTYNLNGGTLSLDNGLYDIGRNTGTHAASQGTLNITAGLLDVLSDNLVIGNLETTATHGEGSGLIAQSGGTLRVEAGSGFFLSASGNGEYDLDGGTLEVGGTGLSADYNGGGGSSTFDLGGGAIVVSGSALTTNANATLVAGTTSTLDLNGLGASFTGSVTGSGTLDITGSGTATFADLDTGGEIDLQAGTLSSTGQNAAVGDLVADGGGSATVSVKAGSTLQLTVANALTVTNGSSLEITGGGTLLVGPNAGALYAGKGGTGSSSSSGSITLDGTTSLTFSPTGYTDLIVAHGEQTVGTTGSFSQSGSSTVTLGSNAIIGVDGGVGTYDLTGNATLTTGTTENFFYIGLNQATGSFNATTSGALNISGSAVFDFESGYLFVAAYADGSDTSGPAGSGSITQSGSAQVTLGGNYIDIGTGSGSEGSYNLEGGTLTIKDTAGLLLGAYAGSDGVLNQTGGTLIDQTGIEIGVSGTGAYELSGGELVAGGAGHVSGTGPLILAGGTIKAAGGQLSVSAAVTLQADTTTTLDLNGLGASFTGSVTGSGTLDIIGVGTATFSGLDTAGAIELADNTLDIAIGSTTSVGGISGSGTLQVDGTLDITAGGGVAVAGLFGAGAIQLDSATLDVSNATGPASIGALSGSGSVILGAGTLSAGGDDASTSFSGTLSGGGRLIKTGTGTFVLNGADNTGALEIDGGTLQLGTSGTLSATTDVTVGASGTLDLNSTTQVIAALGGAGVVQLEQGALVTGSDNSSSSFSGTIHAGANGYLAKVGTGTLTINGATMDGGAFYAVGGSLAETAGNSSILYLAIGEGNGATATGSLSGGTLTVGSNFLLGDFGGSGSFTQTGGVLAVTGSFNIGNQGGDGTYNLNGGTVTLAGGLYDIGRNTSTNAAGQGTLDIAAGLLDVTSGHLIIGNRDATATVGQSSGLITQTGGTLLVEAGAALFLSGYGNGEYDLDGGLLRIGGTDLSGRYAGSGSDVFDLGGGTIQVIGSALVTSVSATLVAGTSSTIDSNALGAAWSGALSGSGALVKTGLGTLALSGNDSLYSGAVDVALGTLRLAAANALSASSDVTVDTGGTLDVDSTTQAIGSLAGSGAVLLGTGTLTAGSDGASTSFSGTLSGNTFIKTGTGTFVLGGADTTSKLDVNGGTLQLAASGTLSATTDVTVGTGSTLDLNSTSQIIGSLAGSGEVLLGAGTLTAGADGASTVFSGTLHGGGSDTGVFTQSGSGTLTLDDATMDAGEFHVADGTVAETTGGSSIFYLAVGEATGNTGTFDLSGGTLTIGNAIQVGDYGGTGSFTQTGGLVAVNGSFNIGNQGGDGTYNLNGGTLTLAGGIYDIGRNSGANAASQGTLNISAGLLEITSGHLVIGNRDNTATNGEGSGAILQTGGTFLVESGTGLFLSGYGNGTYTLDGGVLEIGGTNLSGHYAGSGSYLFNLGGGTIQVIGSTLVTSVSATLVAGTSSTINTNALGATWSGALSGSGALVKTGLGTLALSGNDSLYSGAVDVALGTLQLAAANALSASSDVTVDTGGTLDVDSTTQAIGSLAGSGAVLLGTGTLTAGGDGASTSFAGTLSGSGTFIKSGTGTFVLAGADTTGSVAINGGTLQLGAAGTLSATTNVTVGASGTLDLNSTTQVIGSLGGAGVVELEQGTLAAGEDGASTSFSGIIQAGTNGAFDKVGTGTLTLIGATINSGSFYVGNGSLAESSGSSSIAYLAIGEGTGNTAAGLLSGGTLTIGSAFQIGDLGGTGSFAQTGGVLSITGSLDIGNQGGDGLYSLNGGTLMLSDGLYDIGRNMGGNPAGQGTLSIISGLVDVTSGTLVAGNAYSVTNNQESSGLITQTGGTLRVEAGANMFLSGNGDGEYDLTGGVLEVGGSDLGRAFSNTSTTSEVFNLEGGTIEVIGTALNTDVNATLVAGTRSTLDLGTLGATLTGRVSGAGTLAVTGSGDASFTDLDATGVLDQQGGTVDVTQSGSIGGIIVDGGTTAELAVSAGQTLAIGSAITIGSGAAWTLSGAATLGVGGTISNAGTLTLSGATLSETGALVNNGAIVLDPSTMAVGSLTGAGSVTIETGSSLTITGSVASGETILFAGTSAALDLGSPASVAGSVGNFAFGDTIDLAGIAPGSVTYSDGELQIDGRDAFALGLAGGNSLQIGSSGDGTELTALCFCIDTMIATPEGSIRVQDLAIGDLVTTHAGAAQPIAWIGIGSVLATRGRRTAATPVIVRRSALADNVPSQDLRVTKGHALYLDGVLIPVESLVNHRSIIWDDHAQEVRLFHIELDAHDVLLANGAPAESYRDDGNRWLFRNWNNDWDLPPKEPCAPILTGGGVVDAIWRKLLDRAGPRPGLPLTDEPDLHLIVDGVRLDAAEVRGQARTFRLKAVPGEVRIVSRSAAPDELGLVRDPRVLGVALHRIALSQGWRLAVMEADDTRLVEGFHMFEPDGGLRWTDGDAALPEALFAGFTGACELVIHVACTAHYPLIGTGDRRAA
jgi:autotransporter-associated beta strand protein